MNYKTKAKIIRKYWVAQKAYVNSGFARSESERERLEELKVSMESAQSKMERNEISMNEAIEWRVQNGW